MLSSSTLATPPLPSAVLPADWSGATELPRLGVIRASGADAASFLQGQLTQDVVLMSAAQARLAAFCNPKGRMQASFVVFRHGEDILLVCGQDILAQTLKRLSMFVMRAKARLSDASAEFRLVGLAGAAAREPAGELAPWSRIERDGASLVALPPGAGQPRALWCAPAGTPLPAAAALPAGAWDWLEVQSAIAPVSLPVFEAFVPQMLNYESVGGVNFKKGCYPGQEIVARSQFRGTLKRRAYLLHGAAAATVGQEVFLESDAEQPCGTVAAAAAHPAGGFDLIVSMQTSAAAEPAAGKLRLGAADGPALELLPLPYALLEDI